jgi:hypothetical protein
MINLVPLTSNPTNIPVLLLDAHAPFLDLQECAEQRLCAAKGLLFSLSCMGINRADAKDVSHIAEAAYVLLEDASDLFKAARNAAQREGVRNV